MRDYLDNLERFFMGYTTGRFRNLNKTDNCKHKQILFSTNYYPCSYKKLRLVDGVHFH